MKNKKEIENSNLLNDLFHGFIDNAPKRKEREPASEESEEIEDDAYLKSLEDKKRARYEALKKLSNK